MTATLTYDAPAEFTFGWRAGAAVALPIFTTGRADVAVADATVVAGDRRSRRPRRADGRRDRLGARARDGRAPERSSAIGTTSCRRRFRSNRWRTNPTASGQTGLPAYLQTVQAAREVRQRALQAGLDYQLALADLERAMGTALK